MSSLSVALSALQAHQQSMLVTSQNIANAGTTGYSTQRTVLTANVLKTTGNTIYGGVTATAIDSARDSALDARIYDATSLQSSLDTTSSITSDLESLFGSIDGTNLQTQMEAAASAFNDMATNPDDDAIASAAVESLSTLAALLNQIADGVDSIAASVTDQAGSAVDDVNQTLGELAALNLSIKRSGYAGGSSNEYADQQALLLEKLAGYLQIDASYQDNGEVSVTCDGTMLVSGGVTQQIALAGSSSGTINYVLGDSGIRLEPVSGSMASYQQAVNEDLPACLEQLDAIAVALIDYLGTQQSIGADGGSGSTEMVSATTFSSTQLGQNIDTISYDATHALGFADALAPEFPDSGSCSVMRINAFDQVSGLASSYIVTYDTGSGPIAASRTLQDLVDAINTGSGGGFTLVPAAAGSLSASLVPSSGGYKLVIASTDSRSIDCGSAIDARPSDAAPATQWAAGDAGFVLSGSYTGGASYDPSLPMTIQVTDAGTVGDDTDPPVIQVSIPVEKGGVVSMVTTSYTLDSSHAAGVPIDLGYGMELTFDAGSLALSSDPLEIATDASDDRIGVLGALGIDRVLVGTGARDIQVAAEIISDPSRIATGSARAEGSSDIASAMADLVTEAQVATSSTPVGTAYQQLVSRVGQAVSDAASMGEVQTLVLSTLENQRQILIGVDVDEQMALLIEQQQAYSAAARVISMVRENLTTLISILD